MLAEFFVNFFNYVPDVPFCIFRLNQFNFYFFFSFSLICIDHKFNLTRVSVFQTLLFAFFPTLHIRWRDLGGKALFSWKYILISSSRSLHAFNSISIAQLIKCSVHLAAEYSHSFTIQKTKFTFQFPCACFGAWSSTERMSDFRVVEPLFLCLLNSFCVN